MNKEELIQFISINKSNFTRLLRCQYPILYTEIENKYVYAKFSQKLYDYIYGENEGKCLICNSRCEFIGINKGYLKYCSYKCSGIALNKNANEIRKCKICNNEFKVYKKIRKEYCSNECRLENNRINVNIRIPKSIATSRLKNNGVHFLNTDTFIDKSRETKILKYGNPNYINIIQQKLTKLKRYGSENYNNIEKNKETCLKRYGVDNIFQIKYSNGIRISKPQKMYYEYIKNQYPDAILEHYLVDINLSVDIFIPSINKVIEVYGDYWHCHPRMFNAESYHEQLHMKASKKRELDKKRIEYIESAGYITEVVWESDIKDKILLT